MNFRTDFASICAWIFRLNFSCAGWTHEFFAWIFWCAPSFLRPLSRFRASGLSVHAWVGRMDFSSGFFPCAKFMRQSCSENGAQNKKSMHPKRKIHAKSMREFMRQICALKLVRKRGSKYKIHAPPKRKIMQEFVRSFSLPQAWKWHCPCHTTMQSKSICE